LGGLASLTLKRSPYFKAGYPPQRTGAALHFLYILKACELYRPVATKTHDRQIAAIAQERTSSIQKSAEGEPYNGKAPAKDTKIPIPTHRRKIEELDDWRGRTLSKGAGPDQTSRPDVVEEWKWRGTPVWSHDGILCTGETYKNAVKMTFAKGAALMDPARLFNASLDGNERRAIALREGDEIAEEALKDLIRAAVAFNKSGHGPSRNK
jgi:hypothetical protein